ncbi:MAG: dicarboxylate/amino acid:cation symporter [Flavobacteriales bacterium]|nr:dicarboxylate/amino acid:cation symporter [Flavobacteriales bacterium]MCB9192618.1 dicarboxylate/amino acid:cation symporter [Flavobacteriales bacterium]
MKNLALHWKIIIGLVLGVIFAFISSALGWSEFTINWIDPFGTIFINLLKLIAVPLVLFSIIKGISGLHDTAKLGRLASKTLLFYLVTTVIAVSVGLLLVNSIKPGKLVDDAQRLDNRLAYEIWAQDNEINVKDGQHYLKDERYVDRVAVVQELMASEVPDASLEAKMQSAKKTKDAGPLQFIVDMVPSNIFLSLNNNGLMLQVIFFAIFFGVTLISIPRDIAAPVINFVDGMNEVFLKMVDFVMQAAPFFVFALLAGVISKMAGDDPNAVIEIFKGLGWYSLTVVLGLAFMIFIFYPMLAQLLVKGMNYKRFFRAISPAQFLAFSTSSSAATLPVTMDCVQDNLGVSKETTSFVLPIGATVNMDGTSMYQAIAVVFLAQFHLVDLDMTQQLTIVLTATLASIGSAAVPSAGLIMLIIVLESVGLNPAWVAIIFPVDRILDMCRTTVNVTGDCTVATVVANSEGQLNKDVWSKLD